MSEQEPDATEVNRQIAERLFGWKTVMAGKVPIIVGPSGYTATVRPDFLTWEGMGLVVEEMERRGWKLRIIEASSCYFCFFVQGANEEQGEGATAPEAVARAALKAIGEER